MVLFSSQIYPVATSYNGLKLARDDGSMIKYTVPGLMSQCTFKADMRVVQRQRFVTCSFSDYSMMLMTVSITRPADLISSFSSETNAAGYVQQVLNLLNVGVVRRYCFLHIQWPCTCLEAVMLRRACAALSAYVSV